MPWPRREYGASFATQEVSGPGFTQKRAHAMGALSSRERRDVLGQAGSCDEGRIPRLMRGRLISLLSATLRSVTVALHPSRRSAPLRRDGSLVNNRGRFWAADAGLSCFAPSRPSPGSRRLGPSGSNSWRKAAVSLKPPLTKRAPHAAPLGPAWRLFLHRPSLMRQTAPHILPPCVHALRLRLA